MVHRFREISKAHRGVNKFCDRVRLLGILALLGGGVDIFGAVRDRFASIAGRAAGVPDVLIVDIHCLFDFQTERIIVVSAVERQSVNRSHLSPQDLYVQIQELGIIHLK